MKQLPFLCYAFLIMAVLWLVATGFAESAQRGPKLFVGSEEVQPSCRSIAEGIDYLERVMLHAPGLGLERGCSITDPECYAMSATFAKAAQLQRHLKHYHQYHCLEV